ncbi:hypothetical protein [Streptomyces azureus]|uniref:Uncharacterized protein n=1 Tax=Streptomyces azureus TaxID=146537 RepID=A0A0K8PUZ5_STRAJ|nr:hypothetical protein [Streptomyces azureus]GAP51765.1 uncharacterized protein SAZU_6638 [Streptomyces azureus]
MSRRLSTHSLPNGGSCPTPLGLRPALLTSARQGLPLGQLAASTACEPVARAQLLHLLWHRQLGVGMTEPLTDRSVVVLASRAAE